MSSLDKTPPIYRINLRQEVFAKPCSDTLHVNKNKRPDTFTQNNVDFILMLILFNNN